MIFWAKDTPSLGNCAVNNCQLSTILSNLDLMNLVDEIPADLKSSQSLILDSVPSRSVSSKNIVCIYLAQEIHDILPSG